jgi:eukaryotic-like serine/threonine-protein kinase
MPLSTGDKLGPYEILAPIGAGGMGEVYRARDAKLGRDVALKVVPEAFARDAERMARFQREAKVLASLSHPNIAPIYGLEDSSSTHALVMELIEGPTLADRIKSGPIPISEALPIAKQICEALEYAHERGIVHRDLKPANVKVTSDDAVKVLDFGLAKAIEGDASSMDMANSPTISRMATQAGVLLGTAAYMSPEQAKGKPVDRRADIWAFGCVLYEMLTGAMAFHGETVSDTLAAVIKEEPDWKLLPAETPMRVRVVLQRSLQKDPKQRLRDIGDARISLDEVLSGAPEPSSTAAMMAPAPFWRRALPWALFGAAAIVAAILAWAPWRAGTTHTETALMRFEIPLPQNAQVGHTEAGVFAVSPDGRQLAFAASAPEGRNQIWVRPLDALEARPLAGTESGLIEDFFWSPDSRYIVFSSGQAGAGGSAELLKVAASGSPVQKICDFTGGISGRGWWSPNGVVIFGSASGLMRVSASGGSPQPLTIVRSGEQDAYPQLLPDGRHFLYTHAESAADSVYIGSLDLPPGKQDSKPLLANSVDAVYVPSSGPNGGDPDKGQLLFSTITGGTQTSLMAQPFDARRLKLTGEAVPLAQGVAFSASANGVLAYATAGVSGLHSLTWYNRQGKVLGTAGAPSSNDSLNLSPDGKRAFVFSATTSSRLWLVDFATNATTPFTFPSSPAGEYDGDAVWSPDGSRVIFGADEGGSFTSVYEKPVSGATDERLILKSPGVKHPRRWSPDGRFLLYEAYDLKTGRAEIWALPLGGDKKPVPVLQAGFDVGSPQFSPDGHWMAYASDESGRPEIFVRAFSSNSDGNSFTLGGEWQISAGGGVDPRWGSDGKELYYRGPDGKVMVAEVATKPTFQPGPARELFQGPPLLFPAGADGPSGWGVTPDSKRFLFLVSAEQSSQAQAPFTVVLNWQDMLKQSQ